MRLVQAPVGRPLKLRLARNLVRSIKRGHPWVFAEALRDLPAARPGAWAVLLDNKKNGREIAQGFYDPNSPLAFRACTLNQSEIPDDRWAAECLNRALALRRMLFDDLTTGFRLLNGEGDGLPGLVCDVYGDTAVIQLDGPGPEGFWHAAGVGQWVAQTLSLGCVVRRPQSRDDGSAGQILIGPNPAAAVSFTENGLLFTADVIYGQKTGFFLDQRDNRQRIRKLAAGRRVLNVFGYTGGFSVYAGVGGAGHVTTVDLAAPALEVAAAHWQRNGLLPGAHHTIAADAFEFLEQAARPRQAPWDLVIIDPPSFASAKQAVPKAVAAYQKLVALGAAVTAPNGLLAAASCSSRVGLEAFLNACEEGISKARRRATILGVHGQPADHPTPLAFSEFRYLKFVLMRVE